MPWGRGCIFLSKIVEKSSKFTCFGQMMLRFKQLALRARVRCAKKDK